MKFELEIVKFEVADVITTSGEGNGQNENMTPFG